MPTKNTPPVRFAMPAAFIAGLLVLAALSVAACSPAPSPTPAATPGPSAAWDPRLDVIDQAEAVWDAHQPKTYAYTFDYTGNQAIGDTYRYRVTSLEGHAETQLINGRGLPAGGEHAVTVPGIYAGARLALAGDGTLTTDADYTYGYPKSVTYASQAADGSWSEAITEFLPAGDPAGPARTQAQLSTLLDRWQRQLPAEFEYTWSRFRAADGPAAATVWRVRLEGGKVVSSSESEADGSVPSSAATPEGSIAAAQRVISGGGWVDVAADTGSGRNLLISIDPSPATTGDAYWIRISFVDLVAQKAAKAHATAAARWAANAPTIYAYTWRYRGAGDDLTYKVSVDGDTATIRPVGGTPAVEAAFVAPRVEDTLTLIGDVLAQGGRVTATYDKKLGYPRSVTLVPHGDAGLKGTITIRDFRLP